MLDISRSSDYALHLYVGRGKMRMRVLNSPEVGITRLSGEIRFTTSDDTPCSSSSNENIRRDFGGDVTALGEYRRTSYGHGPKVEAIQAHQN